MTIDKLQALSGKELEDYLSNLPLAEDYIDEDDQDYFYTATPVDKFIYVLDKLESYGLSEDEIACFIRANLM